MRSGYEMRTILLPTAGLALPLLGAPAMADESKAPAGGAFMSSYSTGPYSVPRDPARPVPGQGSADSGGEPRGSAYSSYPNRRPASRR